MNGNEQSQSRTACLASLFLRRVTSLIAAMILVMAVAFPVSAQTLQTLYQFSGQTDGGRPASGVIFDSAGNLYGTTTIGGNVNDCAAFQGCGVVYKLDPSNNLTTLYTFTGGADGQVATNFGSLVRDNAGNLYATASDGGLYDDGVVYEVSPTGVETVLHTFPSGPGDGEASQAGLLRDAAGNLYGTTFAGGAYGYGAVFMLTKDGKEKILHSFNGYDGAGPDAALVADSEGNAYGTANSGGTYGWGTVFKISKSGGFSLIYTFKGAPDGGLPGSPLLLDKEGNIYGTTTEGGAAAVCPAFGCGVIFEITKSGTERVLYKFLGPEGSTPNQLMSDGKGNLYGTTWDGGTYEHGVIFKMDKTLKLTDLYNFTGRSDGGNPWAGLIQDEAGNLYGTTYLGGDGICPFGGWCGTIFKFTPQ